jgi:hypothetical protein
MEDRFRAETGMGMPSSLQAIMDNLSTALGVKDKLLPHEVDMLPNPDADEDGCGNPDCLSCASEKSKGRGDVFPVGNKMGALVMDIPAELSSLHQRALQEYNGAIDVNNLPLKPFSEQLFKAMAGLPDVNPKAKRVIVEILNKNEEAKKA